MVIIYSEGCFPFTLQISVINPCLGWKHTPISQYYRLGSLNLVRVWNEKSYLSSNRLSLSIYQNQSFKVKWIRGLGCTESDQKLSSAEKLSSPKEKYPSQLEKETKWNQILWPYRFVSCSWMDLYWIMRNSVMVQKGNATFPSSYKRFWNI